MDLTKEYPRSVREKMHGLVQLGRTVDKGTALAHGNIGDYHYNCPMDQAVFSFLGVDHEQLLEKIKHAKADSEIDAYLKPYIDKKTPQEIEAWNHTWLATRPQGESEKFFMEMRQSVAPDRTDVVTWADLLDLDEKRQVPRREHATV